MNVMKMFLTASVNPFDVKAALLAGHAQHPVIIHFPIALFIASVVFEVLAAWRKQPVLATVAYYNLLGAALTIPFAIATGLGACSVCNRNWFGSLALATGGRSNKRQLTPAYDLCADFRIADLVSHLDPVASAHQGRFAADILFCSDGTGLNDDHPDRAPRWNPQRGGNAVTSTEQSSNEFQSEVRKVNSGCSGA